MVAWIEKEVEASIMEIDPCFIDPLQRFRFILNVKLIQQFTFRQLRILIENVVQRSLSNMEWVIRHRSNVT